MRSSKSIKSTFLVIILLVSLGSTSFLIFFQNNTYIPWPTEGWSNSTPEQQGMDNETLYKMLDEFELNQIQIDGIMVARNGYVVFKENPSGFDFSQLHMMQSVTKSFTSAAIGILIDKGYLSSVDVKVVDLFSNRQIENMDNRKGNMTVYHLLTMSCGLYWTELIYPYDDPRNTLYQMWIAPDPIQHILDQPMVNNPGSMYSYNSGTSMLLGAIIEKLSGMSIRTFMLKYVFEPLGISDFYWDMLKTVYHSDGGLYLNIEDMLKFGYLFLKNGLWDGQQLISSNWVQTSTSPKYQTGWIFKGEQVGYAYQWWTYPDSVYGATGHYDQRIFIDPDHNIVAAFTADVADDEPHITEDLFFRYVIGAVK